jgi:HSP20 family molecular chaperone IbpA
MEADSMNELTDDANDGDNKQKIADRLEQVYGHLQDDRDAGINVHPYTVNFWIAVDCLDVGDETQIMRLADDMPGVEVTDVNIHTHIISYTWEGEGW